MEEIDLTQWPDWSRIQESGDPVEIIRAAAEIFQMQKKFADKISEALGEDLQELDYHQREEFKLICEVIEQNPAFSLKINNKGVVFIFQADILLGIVPNPKYQALHLHVNIGGHLDGKKRVICYLKYVRIGQNHTITNPKAPLAVAEMLDLSGNIGPYKILDDYLLDEELAIGGIPKDHPSWRDFDELTDD